MRRMLERMCCLPFLVFLSCTQAPKPTALHCIPNTFSRCMCADGVQSGTRRCNPVDSTFEACVCDPQNQRARGTTRSSTSQAPSAAGSGASTAASSAEIVPEPRDEAAYVFDQTTVRTYNIGIAEADLQKIAAQPSAELYVPATLEFEGTVLGPFKVRYKGNSWSAPCTAGGRDAPKAGKCSMKLDFNDQDPSARFHGLKKLNFHSMNNDLSMLRDRLGYALFREMGIAAPRSAHARVLVNGKLEGLFIVVEHVDGAYTRSRFKDGGGGNLYKEVWPIYSEESVYLEKLASNKDDQPTAAGMLAFKAAVDSGPDAVKAMLDRDYLLRYLAVDRVIINDDGVLHFWCDGPGTTAYNGNFYWYEAPSHDKFWLIPWDLDESFDGFPAGRIAPEWTASAACSCSGSGSLYSLPAACDKLTQRFIAWLPDYRAQAEMFVTGPFAPAAVDTKLTAWSQQIAPLVEEAAGKNQAPTVEEWRAALSDLKAKIASAREHRGYAY